MVLLLANGGANAAHADTVRPAAVTQPAASRPAPARLADLLAAARKAYAEHRIVSPAGDNAVEDYEAVLARDPANRVARDALREIFPYAVPHVEAAIARGALADAERQIGLLDKADPGNHTVTLLRNMLAAHRSRPSARATNASLGSGKHVLVLRADAESWVEVTGADGVVDARMLRAGDRRTYRTNGLLRITLGNAAAVAVTADGKPVAVRRFTAGDRVAHLVLFAGHAATAALPHPHPQTR